jgi:hypothetical protein
MPTTRALIAVTLLATAVWPAALRAQRIQPARARPRVLVVRPRETAAPVREAAETVPRSLAAAEKIAMARGALDAGEKVTAVDNTIRLSADVPRVLGKAGLVTHWVRDVLTGWGGNLIRTRNTDGVSGEKPVVEVRFTPDQDLHPVLVDFIVTVTGSVGISLQAQGQGEHRTLAKGEHHVIVLVVPSTAWILSARLQVEPGGPPAYLVVHAVELTTLK